MDIEREVRFAVVMYGGVSLAIYINGVTQELLNLVRATAPATTDDNSPALIDADEKKLPGAMGVYRKLGQHLKEGFDDLEWATEPGPNKQPIRTRFIVDVISGTSAGGINGVFLAKALAQNQTMDGLKKLWLSEGDLSKLLNDSTSVKDLKEFGFTVQAPQQSLLNSQRMYRKLLEALEKMDASTCASSVYRCEHSSGSPSPLVNELDLFITTTDIEGIPLPIALSDRVVFERRYKNVFHFRYAAGPESRDDFEPRNDPFLAFAARCTSSFPFAFEPMCLDHVKEVTENYPRYTGAEEYIQSQNWDRFFSEYLRFSLFDLDKQSRGGKPTGTLPTGSGPKAEADASEKLRKAFQLRPFGDGGYLDNKPFSYATSMLMRRRADYAVQRKLLYVEPSPEHPELLRSNPKIPDFAENVRAAMLDLPRQETIREDIDKLYERNQMIERITTFAREVDTDVAASHGIERFTHKQFCENGVKEMMGRYGISYGAYHRLKVGEVTTFLAEMVARAKGHDPASDAGSAIRELIAAWRRYRYKAERDGTDSRETENLFLVGYDFRYRYRRINFLIRRISELLQLDADKDDDLKRRLRRLLSASLQQIIKKKNELDPDPYPEIDGNIISGIEAWLNDAVSPPAPSQYQIWLDCFGDELEQIKRTVLDRALARVRSTEEDLLNLSADPNDLPDYKKSLEQLREWLVNLNLPWSELKEVLEGDSQQRAQNAEEMRKVRLSGQPPGSPDFDPIAERIREILYKQRSSLESEIKNAPSSGRDGSILAKHSDTDPAFGQQYCDQARRTARRCLIDYDEHFVQYDMVIYPVQYGTGAGEANKVEVFRVSPEDAVELLDERLTGRQKLAGRALMSFGAFLDEGWRRNDMLWGRLDGAERIICALLPLADNLDQVAGETEERRMRREKLKEKHNRRVQLIKEAHVAILKEEINEGNAKVICNLIGTALSRCEPASDHDRKLREVVQRAMGEQGLPEKIRSALLECLDSPEKIWDYYSKYFEVNRQLEAETALRLISRATNITGQMLEGLAENYRSAPGKRMGAWIARLGTVFWNMVAVAVPQGLGNLFFQHWLGLSYLFAFTMILVGIFVNANVKIAGWELLAIVVALHVVVNGLGNFMTGRRRLLTALRVTIILVLMTLIILGTQSLAQSLFGLGTEGQLILSAIVAVVLLCAVSIPPAIAAIGRWIAFKRKE